MKRFVLSLCLSMLLPVAASAGAPSLLCSSAKLPDGTTPEFAREGQLPFSAGLFNNSRLRIVKRSIQR